MQQANTTNCTECPELSTSLLQETTSTGSSLVITTLLQSTPVVTTIIIIAIVFLRASKIRNRLLAIISPDTSVPKMDVTDAEMLQAANVATAISLSELTPSGPSNTSKTPKSTSAKNSRFKDFYKKKMKPTTEAYLDSQPPKMKAEKTKYRPEEVRILIRKHILQNDIFTMKKARESIVKLSEDNPLRIKIFTNAKGWKGSEEIIEAAILEARTVFTVESGGFADRYANQQRYMTDAYGAEYYKEMYKERVEEVKEWLALNGIYNHDLQRIKKIMCVEALEKTNCIVFIGKSNMGKTMLADLLSAFYEDFEIGHVDSQNLKGDFYLTDCVDKQLIRAEEMLITPENVDTIKKLFENGSNCSTAIKYQNGKTIIESTPVIVTANRDLWTHCSTEITAIKNRCFYITLRKAIPEPLASYVAALGRVSKKELLTALMLDDSIEPVVQARLQHNMTTITEYLEAEDIYVDTHTLTNMLEPDLFDDIVCDGTIVDIEIVDAPTMQACPYVYSESLTDFDINDNTLDIHHDDYIDIDVIEAISQEAPWSDRE